MKLKILLASALTVVLGSASIDASSSLMTFEWVPLPLGSKTTVTGRFEQILMDPAQTKHRITLANGQVKRNGWFKRRLDKDFFIQSQSSGRQVIRYNVKGFKADPGKNVRQIKATIRTSNGTKIASDTYNVR